ncbi:MAG: GNAT family N-acetyltransferase [Desulfobacteraceae bacterium]|nr:GNAT family N-acetyltransferase [Desulfobacteraceae bacterium]
MIPHINIKKADIHNAKLLSNIIRASHMDVAKKFNLTIENCPKHPSNCSVDWIKKDFDRGVRYYVVKYSGIPKGCIALEYANADVCYIERLSVLREYRRHGFGEKLVNHAFDEAKALGAKEISIGTIAEFTQLTEWYEKIGFIKGETKEFEHLPFKVLFMRYELT